MLLKKDAEMIILDETKLTNGTLQMIGQDYGMKLSSPIEHPEWYEQEIDMIVDRFKFDIDNLKYEFSENIFIIKEYDDYLYLIDNNKIYKCIF